MMQVRREKDEEIEKRISCRKHTARYSRPPKSNGFLSDKKIQQLHLQK